MGLNERRRIALIKNEELPAAQKQLNEISGVNISLDFDTTTFPEDAEILSSYDFYINNGLAAIVEAVKNIAVDDMGKEAINEKIQHIKIINTSKNYDDPGEKHITLKDGILEVAYGFYRYSDRIWDQYEIQKQLENLL